MKKYKCIDLFAGAGGLSAGFSSRGFEVVGAIENVAIFCKTHQYNFPNSISLNADIREIQPVEFSSETNIEKDSIDLIIGGPPCQTFSTIGIPKIRSLKNDVKHDPRTYLYRSFFQYVSHYGPKMFLMENVPSLETKFCGKLFKNIIDLTRSLGYTPHAKILNSIQYGVPQIRKRLFLVGTKSGLDYSFPEPTHYWLNDKAQIVLSDINGLSCQTLKSAPTVYDAISDLPEISDGNREDELHYSRNEHLTDYQKMLRNANGLVRNNICRMSNDRAKNLFPHMVQGSKYMDLPKEIREILPFREDIFKDRLKRLDESKPSWTVLAHIGMDGYMYIHPTETRTLSVREAARIQSFPDSFIFLGNMREQYIEVGNAVPPILAGRLADSIATALKGVNL